MMRQAFSAIAVWSFIAPAVIAPAIVWADDDDEDEDDYGYSAPAEPQVDVSVDMATPGAAVTFETFHEGLTPYGDWVTVGAYGRVWRPHVAAGWRPYYYGHWVWSDEGWLWVSDEPWGWGPYHYGRWSYDSGFGWYWVPGYQWAPAWVSWRFGGTAVGWAPLAPGFSIYVASYPAIYAAWTFVPHSHFVGAPVHQVAYAHSHVPSVYHGTRPAPPRTVIGGMRAPAWGGPARGFVEAHVGHRIAPARTVAVASPHQIAAGSRKGAIPIYRPERFRQAAPGMNGRRSEWVAPSGPGRVGGAHPAGPAAVPSARRDVPPGSGSSVGNHTSPGYNGSRGVHGGPASGSSGYAPPSNPSRGNPHAVPPGYNGSGGVQRRPTPGGGGHALPPGYGSSGGVSRGPAPGGGGGHAPAPARRLPIPRGGQPGH